MKSSLPSKFCQAPFPLAGNKSFQPSDILFRVSSRDGLVSALARACR